MAFYYTFTIKKGKFELEVTSDNRYFTLMQYEKLMKEIDSGDKSTKKAVKTKETKTEEPPKAPEKQVAKEEPVAKSVEEEKPAITQEAVASTSEETTKEKAADTSAKKAEAAVVEPEPVKEEPADVPVVEPETVTETAVEAEEAEAVVKEEATEQEEPVAETELEEEKPGISDPSKVVDEFLFKKPAITPEEAEKEEETTPFDELLQEKILEKTDAVEPPVVDSSSEAELVEALKQSFDEEEPAIEVPEIKRAKEPEPDKSAKVYDILNEKLASIPDEDKNRLSAATKAAQQEVRGLKFNSLEDLITLKKPQTKLDYLLLTSYYLQENEDTEKYSLKQINALVVPHAKSAVDHSVIHEAVAHEYFEVIPDYLGTAGITEYKITDEGVDYILNEL